MDLHNIAERLERKFGLGHDPRARRRLYAKLERVVAHYGDAAYKIVADCAIDAETANYPDRWFCRAVTARIREQLLDQSPPLPDVTDELLDELTRPHQDARTKHRGPV